MTRLRLAAARVVLQSAEAFVALLCLLASLSYVAGAPQPGSIDALLPGAIRVAWGCYLLTGGLSVLAGLLGGWRRVEKAGLWLLAGPGVAYAAIAFGYGRAPALFASGITLAFAVSFAVQAIDRLQDWAWTTIREVAQ